MSIETTADTIESLAAQVAEVTAEVVMLRLDKECVVEHDTTWGEPLEYKKKVFEMKKRQKEAALAEGVTAEGLRALLAARKAEAARIATGIDVSLDAECTISQYMRNELIRLRLTEAVALQKENAALKARIAELERK